MDDEMTDDLRQRDLPETHAKILEKLKGVRAVRRAE
jgi:hypothetical protein